MPTFASGKPSLTVSSIDKIDTYFTPTKHTHLLPSLLQFPSGSCHISASRGFSSTATIPRYQSPSFTTDNQQTWLPQPPSPRPTTTQHTFIPQEFGQSSQVDFVLFPTPTFVHQVQSQTELVRETLCTIPSSDPKLTTLGQPQPRHPINRRNTIQLQHSGSPFQNPRVRNSLQGPTSGESNMSPRSNPNGSHNFYASSAPSSTLALSKQQPSYSRPPVPLFTSNSTENMHSHGGSAMATTSSPKVMVSGNYYDESSVDSLFDYSVFDGKEEFDFQISNFRPTDNTASTQSSSPPQTVSPQDVLLDTISAPPSSTMTNFSTPGTYPTNSPFITTSADPSPLYEQDFLTDEANQWEPLFPTEGDVSNGAMFGNNSIEYEASDVAVPPPMSRNQSSPGRSSRGSHQGRHSSISGVNARKRNNPLPPITVDDPNDSVAVKRARNTAAARKSRARKIERMEELEETIEKLTAERDHWKRIALGGHTEV